MSFFSETDEQRRIRLDRERMLETQRREERERKYQLQRAKDKELQKKRKEKQKALQKEIDDEVQRLMDENSPEKKKERLQQMTGSSLMKCAFGLNSYNTAHIKGLKSAEFDRSIGSQCKNGTDDNNLNSKVPKLNRPF